MRYMTYEKDGKINWGSVDCDKGMVYPKDELFENAPETLTEFVICGGMSSNKEGLTEGIDINDVEILSPIMPHRNVFCIGKNYLDHVKELSEFGTGQFSPDADLPIFFTKTTTCINTPYGGVPLHENVTSQVDYEAELAVVIGKEGINIKAENAYEHIFGYTVLNDFTARDIQKAHKQWFKGKSLDGYCPIGPWIVTHDEVRDPQKLDISSYVNGEMRQSSNTKNMIFPIAQLIEDLSKGITLLPGDIIATGTPKGVGAGFKPPKFLKRGDVVKVVIEQIGEIENTIV